MPVCMPVFHGPAWPARAGEGRDWVNSLIPVGLVVSPEAAVVVDATVSGVYPVFLWHAQVRHFFQGLRDVLANRNEKQSSNASVANNGGSWREGDQAKTRNSWSQQPKLSKQWCELSTKYECQV